MAECCCTERKKLRDEEELRRLTNRLSRIEGQIRGLRGMLEKDAYCPDILRQVAAASAALDAFSRELLASHIRSCVVEDIRAGREGTIDELTKKVEELTASLDFGNMDEEGLKGLFGKVLENPKLLLKIPNILKEYGYELTKIKTAD